MRAAARDQKLKDTIAQLLARRFGVSACDARFLAVAETLRSPLVTEDARLRAAAPSLTRSLAEALRGP